MHAVRERFGDILLQVDANAAYTLADARHLAKLDAFDLLLIEQPLPEDDVLGHAELRRPMHDADLPRRVDHVGARRGGRRSRSARAAIVNIKPGRVGGYLEARRIHDVCVANGVPVWCGGMLETGIGRAANVALAALRASRCPGDTSASGRYFAEDVTEPFVLRRRTALGPGRPGLGVAPIPDVLERFTTSVETVRPAT